jgi:hypothetical protein
VAHTEAFKIPPRWKNILRKADAYMKVMALTRKADTKSWFCPDPGVCDEMVRRMVPKNCAANVMKALSKALEGQFVTCANKFERLATEAIVDSTSTDWIISGKGKMADRELTMLSKASGPCAPRVEHVASVAGCRDMLARLHLGTLTEEKKNMLSRALSCMMTTVLTTFELMIKDVLG